MPYPIPNGKNFSVSYTESSSSHAMPFMCSAHDFYELGFIVSGERKSITNERTYFIHSGAVIITCPHFMHRTESSADVDYKRYLIKFSTKVGEKVKKQLGAVFFNSLCSEHIFYFTEEHRNKIHRLFDEMLHEYEVYDCYSETVLFGILLQLLVCVNRWKMPDITMSYSKTVSNEIIVKTLSYMHRCPDFPSLVDSARYSGLSPSYFSRLFKKSTGKTYSEYIISVRLLCARNLLMLTDKNLEEIASEIGFPNGNYVSTVFRKYFKMTPTVYKKKYSGSDSFPDPLPESSC